MLEDAVARAQAGDEEAFATVYRLLQPGLLGYLHVLVGDAAGEVAARAWRDIARDLPRFRGDAEGFRGWTATVVRGHALARPPGDPAQAAGAFAPAAVSGAARQALGLVAGLPPDEAEAVLLQAVVGLTGPTAARVLGLRTSAVRSAAHRGLRQLAEQLGDREVPENGVPENGPHTLGTSL
jgi:RNA polymerase sigma-70 factor (ECF subfamily)